jgi:predicted CoA-substrate-specific enzyme activase
MGWHEMSRDAVVETLQTSRLGPTVGEARRRRSRDMFVNRARPSRTAASTSITIGIDVGAVSVKVAAAGDPEAVAALRALGGSFTFLESSSPHTPLVVSHYRRLKGSALSAVRGLLEELAGWLPSGAVVGVRATGAGSAILASRLGLRVENEFKAIVRAASILCPSARTLFEMGGETSKFIRLDPDGRILDYETNGDCAAGTGSFIDQQATRLRYQVEEIAAIALGAPSAARIAGRCSVFAKTDMIHAQQKGATPPEILRGLSDAVARNFKASISKGKPVVPPVAFIGGLAANGSVVRALREAFGLGEDLFVPEAYAWFGAVGAALLARDEPGPVALDVARLTAEGPGADFPTLPPLSLDRVILLRDRITSYQFPSDADPVELCLGIDVGSVSTNFALVDEAGHLAKEIYVRTDGRPIEVVTRGLRDLREEFGDRLRIMGVGTTGSGRELIGELVGADAIHDEITAHKMGAAHVARTLTGEAVDTIFEIGGQDAKFIRVEDEVVVDFTMNEACAAGTGSFLEEQAERLGVAIVGEFSRLALSSSAPIRLGERCTVFMEQDVNAYLKRGATVPDLVAGLAYSVALNYLNRVVRGRKIGEAIYFQGGAAYNDSVAAAFATLLGKRIIVPPHNGVIGAIGAALLAWDAITRSKRPSCFRGFELSRVRYSLREFVCRACSNVCDMQEFTVEGVKTYWGDKCSWKFRRRAKTERRPVIEDLVALRDRLCWGGLPASGGGLRVGTPRTMSFYDYFPFWRAFLEALGCEVVLSEPTNRQIAQVGQEWTVAEPCFPVKVAHGHLADLMERGVDWILLPNIMDAEAPAWTTASHLCPWSQTLPFVLRSVARAAQWRERLLIPTVRFRQGPEAVAESLRDLTRRLGASRRAIARAVQDAYVAQHAFTIAREKAGEEALTALAAQGEPGIILLGRSYNIYDRAINLDLPGKLRDHYGINVIPLDVLPLEREDISDLNDNMYWSSGRRILAAARIAGRHPRLDLIYITNFKCGPDSYIKHFVGAGVERPFLTLQFDGHGNDAGMLTRCEAYLESKGVLRR